MEVIFRYLLLGALIAAVYFVVKKQWKKAGISFLTVIISFLGFAVTTPEDPESSADEPEQAEIVAESSQPEETEEEVEEEVTEEPSDENIAFLDSGVALYTDDREIVFGEKSHLENFSGNHVQTLKENHSNFENGVIFRNIMPLQDEYGNQTMTNVVTVYYSPETIDKINFDNWPTLDATGLYETADNVFIHYALLSKVNEFQKYADLKDAPQDFLDYAGTIVE